MSKYKGGMQMDKLYIVMPAYNEEENIIQTLDSWYPVIEKYSAKLAAEIGDKK